MDSFTPLSTRGNINRNKNKQAPGTRREHEKSRCRAFIEFLVRYFVNKTKSSNSDNSKPEVSETILQRHFHEVLMLKLHSCIEAFWLEQISNELKA